MNLISLGFPRSIWPIEHPERIKIYFQNGLRIKEYKPMLFEDFL